MAEKKSSNLQWGNGVNFTEKQFYSPVLFQRELIVFLLLALSFLENIIQLSEFQYIFCAVFSRQTFFLLISTVFNIIPYNFIERTTFLQTIPYFLWKSSLIRTSYYPLKYSFIHKMTRKCHNLSQIWDLKLIVFEVKMSFLENALKFNLYSNKHNLKTLFEHGPIE